MHARGYLSVGHRVSPLGGNVNGDLGNQLLATFSFLPFIYALRSDTMYFCCARQSQLAAAAALFIYLFSSFSVLITGSHLFIIYFNSIILFYFFALPAF